MLYTVSTLALLYGANAFQMGYTPARATMVRGAASLATMQVAEAEVASPVALAKVRRWLPLQC